MATIIAVEEVEAVRIDHDVESFVRKRPRQLKVGDDELGRDPYLGSERLSPFDRGRREIRSRHLPSISGKFQANIASTTAKLQHRAARITNRIQQLSVPDDRLAGGFRIAPSAAIGLRNLSISSFEKRLLRIHGHLHCIPTKGLSHERKQSYTGDMFTAALVSLAIANHQPADHVRFVVMGDDRVEMSTNGPDRATDNYDTGINEGVLAPMWDAVFKEPGLNFVVFTGDLVSGESRANTPANRLVRNKLEVQLAGWTKLLMAHQPSTPIPVYPVRGNHEIGVQGRTRDDANKAWDTFFKDLMEKEKIAHPPTSSFSYAIRDYPGVLMLGIDTFSQGKEFQIDNEWVKSEIGIAPTKHVFPFLHSMCFFAGNHTDYVGGKAGATPAETMVGNRNAFLDVLKGANSKYIFAGHDHFLTVVDAKWDGYTVRQVVGGTAGAPFVKIKPIPAMEDKFALTNPVAVENTYGYVVVDVDGDKVTVTFKSFDPATGATTAKDISLGN